MAWTDLTFSFGAVLTSSQMTNLDDNFEAFANKDSGAPVLANGYVATAMIADNNVTTAKLATGEQMTTTNVLAKTAAAAVGAVGTYALMDDNGSSSIPPGDTVAGSALLYANAAGLQSNTTPSGTWRLMGFLSNADQSDSGRVSLWLRIS